MSVTSVAEDRFKDTKYLLFFIGLVAALGVVQFLFAVFACEPESSRSTVMTHGDEFRIVSNFETDIHSGTYCFAVRLTWNPYTESLEADESVQYRLYAPPDADLAKLTVGTRVYGRSSDRWTILFDSSL